MKEPVLAFIIVFFTALSAFFSGSENVLAALGRIRNKKASESDKETIAAGDITSYPEDSVAAILLGKILANTAAVFGAAMLAVSRSGVNGQAAAVIAMTFILILFGEIFPKAIGTEYAEILFPVIENPLRAMIQLLSPPARLISRFTDKLPALQKAKEPVPPVTLEELCAMVEEIEEEGVFSERESELIRSAIEFTDVTAREIMTPRVDIDAFDIEAGTEVLLADRELLRHSYFPVYLESPDNIIGIISSRQVIKAAVCGEEININELIQPLIFVFMTRTISSVLHELRQMRRSMAVVVDEYGGTMGIITAEDIIEEIVGEIYDEKDETEEEISDAGGGSYIVDGSLNIYDMFEFIGYEPRDFTSEYTTAGGWATEVMDRFPQEGDVFEYDILTVTITEAQAMRVEKLLVKIEPSAKKEE